MLEIPAKLLGEVFKNAEKEYPHECCGLILSKAAKPFELIRQIPIENVQDRYHAESPADFPRTSRNAYFMDPLALLKIQKACRLEKEEIRVIYHSHPDADASFSEEDQKQAAPWGEPLYPGVFYGIVSVRAGKAEVWNLFYWDQVARSFKPQDGARR